MALLDRTTPSLPAAWYYDPAQYARELEAIWYRDWVCVGRIEDLPEAGDYFLVELGAERIIVTRDREGRPRAFHNTCRHRGSTLCTAPRGRFAGGRITCPYHAWSYALSGELVATPKMDLPADFRREDYPLYARAGGHLGRLPVREPGRAAVDDARRVSRRGSAGTWRAGRSPRSCPCAAR